MMATGARLSSLAKGVVLLSVALLAALGAASAHADDSGIPQSVDELLEIYGIADEPADYVVVVDTSASMLYEPPIYPAVKEVYQSFVQAISANDHLSVVTFGGDAVVRFNGVMTPEGRQQAMDALPAVADGGATDIGDALEAALERLDRPDGAQVRTLIFLTDGEIYAPGSPYEQPGNQAWEDLAARAAQLSENWTISVYGAGLGGGQTDIGVLKDVFPRAKIVSLPSDQLADFFNEAVQRSRVEKLRLPVTQELERSFVHVTIDPGRLDDTTRLWLTFDSKLPNLGASIVVRGVTVSAPDGTVYRSTLVGGPRTVTVGPNRESERFEVLVDVPGVIKDFHVGDAVETRDFLVEVDADLEVEPAAILVQELGIEATPQLAQAGLATAENPYGTPYWHFAVAAGILVLIVAFLIYLYRRLLATPSLNGFVRLPDGSVLQLRGKEETIPNHQKSFDGGGSAVTISTRPRKFKGHFSVRRPRHYARLAEGTARHDAYGSEDYLTERPVALENDHDLVIGPSRITFISSAKKGK